jgi:hypothetical protein
VRGCGSANRFAELDNAVAKSHTHKKLQP